MAKSLSLLALALVTLVVLNLNEVECWRRRSGRRRRSCSPVNCAWHWQNGACQGRCGTGTMTKTITIDRQPSCGGAACPGVRSETHSCNTGRCCPINCVTSNWGAWGACNAQCDRSGSQARTRRVTIAAQCGGAACPGLVQHKTCQGPCCRKNCAVSTWGSWGGCNAPCEKSGSQARSRVVTTAARCGGAVCPGLVQHKTCQGPCCKRDCTMKIWSAWGKCNAKEGSCSVNTGSQSRSREVSTKQSCGGSCFPLQESKKCTPLPSDCTVKYSYEGCFPLHQSPKLKEIIMTERDPSSRVWNGNHVDWMNWNTYIQALIKRCADTAHQKGFKVFALKYYAECWADRGVTDAKGAFGGTTRTPSECVKEDYAACQNGDARCIGKHNGLAVYQILP